MFANLKTKIIKNKFLYFFLPIFLLIMVFSLIFVLTNTIFANVNTQNDKNQVSNIISSQKLYGYHNYSTEYLKNIENRKILLYFSAPWCSSCNFLDKDIAQNQAKIPQDVTILKVDYDSNFALRRQYKITNQHTLVLIDKNEKEVNRWSGTENLDLVLKNLGIEI